MAKRQLFWAVLFGLALLPYTASAQLLVYKIEITKPEGVNFHTFNGGYAVAPLLGGSVSFLLTTNEDGEKTYASSAEAGTLFTAVEGSKKKSVLFSTTGADSVSGAVVAMGDIEHVVRISSSTLSLAARVAKTLKGTLVSANDESDTTEVADDSSIGSAGMAEVKLILDEDETTEVNRQNYTQEAAVESLTVLLERRGYSSAEADAEDGDTDTDATDTTTGTTTTDGTTTTTDTTGTTTDGTTTTTGTTGTTTTGTTGTTTTDGTTTTTDTTEILVDTDGDGIVDTVQ